MRTLHGLIWARPISRPANLPVARPRGVKKQGILYEGKLAGVLEGAKRGQWFEFCDRQGLGICQPDFILGRDGEAVVLEAKYTWVPEAHYQFGQYVEVVRMALQRPARGIVVCRRLRPNMGHPIVSSLEEAIAQPEAVWHWIGV